MLTRDIDAGLFAIDRCRAALPQMLRHFAPDSRERAVLIELLASVRRASEAVAWKAPSKADSAGR
jgi:hypothetical protein